MNDTYLVQRLKKPPKTEFHAKLEQAFGGGMLMLKDEAWKILQQVFGIDYMGASEYEFGTIPRTLNALVEDSGKLRAFEFTVAAKDIEPNWDRKRPVLTKRRTVAKKQPVHPPVSDKTVYVLCREEHREGAQEVIRKAAKGPSGLRTKCGTRFADALDPIGEFDSDICGWLELDNGFFWFLDKTMWEQTTQLFTGKAPG